MSTRSKFLTAVLGSDGAQALLKAAERSEDLGNALVPRTILAWLNATRQHEGEIPGADNTYVTFVKSETGFTGSVAIGEEMMKFEDASVFQLVASVTCALDLDKDLAKSRIRDVDLERLGKSIDLLAKASRIRDLLYAKAKPETEEDADLDKAAGEPEGHAPNAKHTPPKPPTPPIGKQPPMANQKPKTPKAKVAKPAQAVASYTLKISKRESTHACPVCGIPQFKGHEFKGCLCMRALAKSARVLVHDPEAGSLIELTDEYWDDEAVATLLESMGRR